MPKTVLYQEDETAPAKPDRAAVLEALQQQGLSTRDARAALMPRTVSPGRRPKRLFTYDDVAALYGVQTRTVRIWFSKGGRLHQADLDQVVRDYVARKLPHQPVYGGLLAAPRCVTCGRAEDEHTRAPKGFEAWR